MNNLKMKKVVPQRNQVVPRMVHYALNFVITHILPFSILIGFLMVLTLLWLYSDVYPFFEAIEAQEVTIDQADSCPEPEAVNNQNETSPKDHENQKSSWIIFAAKVVIGVVLVVGVSAALYHCVWGGDTSGGGSGGSDATSGVVTRQVAIGAPTRHVATLADIPDLTTEGDTSGVVTRQVAREGDTSLADIPDLTSLADIPMNPRHFVNWDDSTFFGKWSASSYANITQDPATWCNKSEITTWAPTSGDTTGTGNPIEYPYRTDHNPYQFTPLLRNFYFMCASDDAMSTFNGDIYDDLAVLEHRVNFLRDHGLCVEFKHPSDFPAEPKTPHLVEVEIFDFKGEVGTNDINWDFLDLRGDPDGHAQPK